MPKSDSYPSYVVQQQHSQTHSLINSPHTLLQICYRPFQSEDLNQIRLLDLQWFPVRYSQHHYRNLGKEISCWVAVALVQGEQWERKQIIVGCITWNDSYRCCVDYMLDEKTVYILTIGVIDQFRSKGIASQLLKKVQQEVDKSKQIHLNVISFNSKALKFYLKNGFRIQYLHKHYYTLYGQDWDSYFMVKTLRPGKLTIFCRALPLIGRFFD